MSATSRSKQRVDQVLHLLGIERSRPASVNPTRSANRTVTTRRSSPGDAAGRGRTTGRSARPPVRRPHAHDGQTSSAPSIRAVAPGRPSRSGRDCDATESARTTWLDRVGPTSRSPIRVAPHRRPTAIPLPAAPPPWPAPSTPSRSTARATPRSRALDGVTVDFDGRPLHRDHGPVRLGQVDADALRRRPRHAHLRPGLHRRHRPRARSTTRSSPSCAATSVGFIFQAFNLVPTLTALENITLPIDLAGRKPDKAWLDQVVAHRRPGRPAQAPPERALRRPAAARRRGPGPGQPARDHLRRRAHRQPRLPRRRRDPRLHAPAVRELGQTIVMVTHDPVAAAYADRVAVPRRRPHRRRDARDPPADAVLDRMKRFGD